MTCNPGFFKDQNDQVF